MKTTLCYIEHDGKYLMMLRNKKAADISEGKWVGVGGKFELGETPDECLVREVWEETGFKPESYELRGIVYFVNDRYEDEDMYLYTATLPQECFAEGALPVPECDEGTFEWIPIDQVETLPLWEGDKYFLRKLAAGERDINMTARYEGDVLVAVEES